MSSRKTLANPAKQEKNAEKLNLLCSFHHVISAQQQKKIQNDGHATTNLVTPCMDTVAPGHKSLLFPLNSETKYQTTGTGVTNCLPDSHGMNKFIMFESDFQICPAKQESSLHAF